MIARSLPVLFALVLVLAARPVPAQEDEPRPLPENLLVETLENGLVVVIEEDHAAPIVDVRAYMRIGSMYEGDRLGSGLSHYMEHIVSGGTTSKRGETESKRLLKSIGDDSNASTYFNFTQYYIATKAEFLETAVDLISDWLQHCEFDPGEVAREQEVVQQELLRNLDDPDRVLSRTFTELMFKVHPVRVPVIGYQDCIQRLTRDDMLAFYEEHYTPQNCVVGIVGAVDKRAALEVVKQRFGTWKRKPLAPYVIPDEPVQTSPRWLETEHASTRTARVLMGVPTIALTHPDLYALDMLANVLGASASARLPRIFEHDPERHVVATGVYTSSWTPTFGAGRFTVGFGADDVPNARRLVREIWAEMERLREDLVDESEIARALRGVEKSHYQGRATVDGRCQSLVSNVAWVNDPLFDDRYLEGMRRVTPEAIREAARKYLGPERLSVAILAPPGSLAAADSAREVPTAGQVEKTVFDNGLTLLVKPLPGHGLVDVTAAFHGGVLHEDEETNGLFYLMGNTFWRGTRSTDFATLTRRMDELGMELSAESHNNVYFVQMSSLASNLDESLPVFAEVLLEPAIEEAWVRRVQQILLERVLPNLEARGTEVGRRALREALYSTHPYRLDRYGTPETVASFTAADVRRCYETYTRPNRCVLAVYGDVDPAAVRDLVGRLFAGWERAEIPAGRASVEDPGPTSPEVVEIEMDQVRTNAFVGWRAFSRQEEESTWALSVLNSIVGTTSGWLHARLREGDAHYVYAVHGIPYTGDQAGHYWIQTDFKPEDEAAVMAVIEQVVEDAKAGRFADEELETAKRSLLADEALRLKRNADVCQGDALQELYGQGYDHDERRFAGIARVTREDVVAAARTVFGRPAVRILVRPPAPEEDR